MENFQQPKVEYSVAVEAIKRLEAQLLALESIMVELKEMHNKTENIIEDLMGSIQKDQALKNALADNETSQSWQGIIEGYQKELLEYRARIAKIEEKRNQYKNAISAMISSEQWMQEQMEGEGHGNA